MRESPERLGVQRQSNPVLLADHSSVDLASAEATLHGLADLFVQNDPSRPLSFPAPSESSPPVSEESKYRLLVNRLPAVVFMASLEGGIGDAYVSPQIEAALGFSQGEWLEDPLRWYQHIHPDDKERWSIEAAEMFISGAPLKSVYRVIARNGRVVWFQCEASMLRREDGRPCAIHGVGFDITKLKESERTLYEKNRQLELLKDVATSANQATTVAEAMQFAVERICAFTGFPLGHACIASASRGAWRLLPSGVGRQSVVSMISGPCQKRESSPWLRTSSPMSLPTPARFGSEMWLTIPLLLASQRPSTPA